MGSGKGVILLGSLLIACTFARSQVPVISIHCDSIPFAEFVGELEKKTKTVMNKLAREKQKSHRSEMD